MSKKLTVCFLIFIIISTSLVCASEASYPGFVQPTGDNNINGFVDIYVEAGNSWSNAGALAFNRYIRQQSIDLKRYIVNEGPVRIKLMKSVPQACQIDYAAFNGSGPIRVNGSRGFMRNKLLLEDNDLLDFGDVIYIDFDGGSGDGILTLSARIEDRTISKEPFKFPVENTFKDMDDGSAFYSYTINSSIDSPVIDGNISDTADKEPFFKEYCKPESGHPDGYIYGWVSNNENHLFVTLDFTSDNTMDGDKDYGSVYVRTDAGIKEFKVSMEETEWGMPGFVYTDKVTYQHKVYEFKIPIELVNAEKTGGNIDIAFAAYGTASPAFIKADNIVLDVNAQAGVEIRLYPNWGSYLREISNGLQTFDFQMIGERLISRNVNGHAVRKILIDSFAIMDNSDFTEYVGTVQWLTFTMSNWNNTIIPFEIIDSSLDLDIPAVLKASGISELGPGEDFTVYFSEKVHEASRNGIQEAFEDASGSSYLTFDWSLANAVNIKNYTPYSINFSNVSADVMTYNGSRAQGLTLLDPDLLQVVQSINGRIAASQEKYIVFNKAIDSSTRSQIESTLSNALEENPDNPAIEDNIEFYWSQDHILTIKNIGTEDFYFIANVSIGDIRLVDKDEPSISAPIAPSTKIVNKQSIVLSFSEELKYASILDIIECIKDRVASGDPSHLCFEWKGNNLIITNRGNDITFNGNYVQVNISDLAGNENEVTI